MSRTERYDRDTFDPGEALGDVPPQEALQVLAHEHEKTVHAPRPEGALTLEDLERMQTPLDRELILAWA